MTVLYMASPKLEITPPLTTLSPTPDLAPARIFSSEVHNVPDFIDFGPSILGTFTADQLKNRTWESRSIYPMFSNEIEQLFLIVTKLRIIFIVKRKGF